MHITAEVICELSFIDVKIATDKDHNEAVIVILLVHNSLAALFKGHLKEAAYILNGMDIRSIYLLKLLGYLVPCVFDNACSRLHISTEAALLAYCDAVLTDRRKKHELMRNTSAHHTAVRRNGDDFRNTCSRIYALVSLVATVVVLLQILLGCVE